MKKWVATKAGKVLGLGLASSFCLFAFVGRADLEVSGSVRIQATAEFNAPLATYGTWIQAGSYGPCWRPARIAVGWRPYCYGHWVWTDCGWYWASDEPWGWACYHYGYWVDDPEFGWIWIPGVEWGPAWVCWRVGGGYIGWAPLAPHGVVVAEPQFAFVATARFTDPLAPQAVVINNPTLFKQTTVVNNVKRETRNLGGGAHERVVVNEGPGLAALDKKTVQRIHQVPIREAARQAAPPARFSPAGTATHNQKPPAVPGAQSQPAWGNDRVPVEPHTPSALPAAPGRDSGSHEGKGHESEHGKGGQDHGKDQS